MILTVSTHEKSTLSSKTTIKSQRFFHTSYVLNSIIQPVNDVIVVFGGYPLDYECDLNSNDLTDSSMVLSQTSFEKEWENEDDDYWNSYL